jgi:hypothetical protein
MSSKGMLLLSLLLEESPDILDVRLEEERKEMPLKRLTPRT